MAEAVAPAVFGIRIECAQCHDHMIAHEIEQRHYWGLVAFFNRSKNVWKTPKGPRLAESAIGGFSDFADLEGGSAPNLLTFFEASTVEEARPAQGEKQEDKDDLYDTPLFEGGPRVPKFSRREKFVTEIVRDHPLVAKAFVNRIWAMILGRGIVHPFDKIDSAHEPSHPELLEWLAQDFRDSGYDIRRLVRMIARSNAYQLDSIAPEGVSDPAYFAYYIERPLTAEQLARSVQLAVRGEFRNDHPLVNQIRKSLPQVMPETISHKISEALFLSNNPALNNFIRESQAEGQLIPQLKNMPDDSFAINHVYTLFYGRKATSEEQAAIAQFLAAGDENSDRYQHLIWAIVTSAEFQLNH